MLWLYNAWALFWFLGIFLLLFPFTYLFLQHEKWHLYAHKINKIWAALFFPLIGKPLRIKHETTLDTKQAYVFVANHFSYLDIAVGMGIFDNYFAYVGKSSVSKVPLFGYMFRKLHIMVNRGDKNSRSQSLMRGIKTLQSGRSIFIMPEGGILSKTIPEMLQPFKDGAFLMAIQNQVPIVPITFVNLYKIMPETMLLGGTPEIVIHAPIETKGKTKDDVESLKAEVYQVIQGTINQSLY